MRHKLCVFVCDTQAESAVVALELEREGIAAQVVDKTTLGMSVGVSFVSDEPAGDGWQIWVNDEADVEKATTYLDARQAEMVERKERNRNLDPIQSVCENCQTETEFAGEFRGTVQDCPKCGAYLDVEGGEDEFEWPEFNESDRED